MPETLADGSIKFEAKLPTEDETQELYQRYGDALEPLEHRVFELGHLTEALYEGGIKG